MDTTFFALFLASSATFEDLAITLNSIYQGINNPIDLLDVYTEV